jgi:hypothetical protein
VGGNGAPDGVQVSLGLPTTAASDAYWSKLETASVSAVAQSAMLMDPRLNPHHREAMVADPRHVAMEDLRAAQQSQQHALGSYVDNSTKTLAFSPIQGSILRNSISAENFSDKYPP